MALDIFMDLLTVLRCCLLCEWRHNSSQSLDVGQVGILRKRIHNSGLGSARNVLLPTIKHPVNISSAMLMSRFWPNPPSFHQSPFAPEQIHPAHNSKGARETPWNNSLFSVLIVLLPLLPHEATCRMLLPAACLWGSLSRPWPTLAPPDIKGSEMVRVRAAHTSRYFQHLQHLHFGKLWDFESIWWFLMIFDDVWWFLMPGPWGRTSALDKRRPASVGENHP